MTDAAQKSLIDDLPIVRGDYRAEAKLGAMGWFRAGGTAEVLFKPADRDDLVHFLKNCPTDIPIQVFGVMSNCIIRDGGVRGVVIRLGREFGTVEKIDDVSVRAGVAALDGSVAKFAADNGIAGLEFYSGIPGTIGGALRMNAGCYGTETKDVMVSCEALDRAGNLHVFHRKGVPSEKGPGGVAIYKSDFGGTEMELSYRHNGLPTDFIFLSGTFAGEQGDVETIKSHIQDIKTRRIESQPIREKTSGSTFANPTPEEIAAAGLPEGTKVWQIIDAAGCRGLQIGGAQMSEQHCNFMINTGDATAADLEALGEEVRRRVYEHCGIRLRWEVRRIGEEKIDG